MHVGPASPSPKDHPSPYPTTRLQHILASTSVAMVRKSPVGRNGSVIQAEERVTRLSLWWDLALYRAVAYRAAMRGRPVLNQGRRV